MSLCLKIPECHIKTKRILVFFVGCLICQATGARWTSQLRPCTPRHDMRASTMWSEGGYFLGTTSCSNSNTEAVLLKTACHDLFFTRFSGLMFTILHFCFKELPALLCKGPESAPANRRWFQTGVCVRCRCAADTHYADWCCSLPQLHTGRQPHSQRAGRCLHPAG